MLRAPCPAAVVPVALVVALGLAALAMPSETVQQPSAGRQASQAPPLRAGAARVDVTPGAPVALGGYEEPENRVSEGVHDRLYARALALASGTKRLVLVSVDAGAMTLGAYFRRPILERHGLRADELLLCEIHTHSGPQVSLSAAYPHPNNLAYTRSLEERLVTVVGEALANLAPARLSAGRGSSRVGASRRKPTPDGRIVMAANPDGPRDDEVLVLEFSRPGGQAFAALFNYACHSRALRAPNRLVSGDVLGIAEQFVEARRQGDYVAAVFPGASADIDPVELADGFAAEGTAVAAPVRLGERLGLDVMAALEAVRPVDARGGIRTTARQVMLPAKAAGAAARPVNLVAAAVGPVAFVGIECETAVEIGLALKAASPFAHTFVLSICNGWAGYLPVAHQYPEGGYEVAHTSYGPAAADLLVKEALAMLSGLQPPGGGRR